MCGLWREDIIVPVHVPRHMVRQLFCIITVVSSVNFGFKFMGELVHVYQAHMSY